MYSLVSNIPSFQHLSATTTTTTHTTWKSGDLKAGNFVHLAKSLNGSGGGAPPTANDFPQCFCDSSGTPIPDTDPLNGSYFVGYWLTKDSGSGINFSNTIFIGGWYTYQQGFTMTSGSGAVHVCPNADSLPSLATDNPTSLPTGSPSAKPSGS